ncbi:unnamed protein product [Mytilus edulis]|uniref:WSC domain-containing protein n=1 Tax=Mytilus edulis TaxID=6550 RepID=A0A8S3QCD3_MYTED|nr:unnamed protein product [Mytilus edulis]
MGRDNFENKTRCGRILSSLDSRINVKTAADCLRHCSELSSATYFAIKTSTCFCLTERPEIKGDINDCRTECTNATYTPCSSGGSAMVFILDKDVNIEESNTYIEHECLATTKQDKSKFAIWDCNTRKLYGCTNTSRKLSGEELCLALTKEATKHFTAENCSCQFPFLCSGSQKKITIVDSSSNNRYPRFITLPTSVVVAFILLVIILIFSMVITSIKAFRRIRIYQEKLKMVNERLPGTEFSNYTGIVDANEEVHDSAYEELSDNVSLLQKQRQERKMDTSDDPVDFQGYLVPEQHYHTIPEVEVHYAAADVAESNPNKENVDSDDYLEPVI